MRKTIFFLFFLISFFAKSQETVPFYQIYGEAISGGLMIGYAPEAQRVLFNNNEIKLSHDGYFVFGFDRDDTGAYPLHIIFANGITEKINYNVSKRTYKVQRINNLEQKYVSPPAHILEKIEKERQIIIEARKKIDTTQYPFYISGFMRPVVGGRISGVYGSQRILNGEAKNPHNGIDVALPTGSPVYAMADAIVCLKGDDFHYNGNFVLLDHGQGLNSVYVHLHKTFVQDGDLVKKGDIIGEVGSTGRSTGPHLHWGVQWFSKRIDPEIIINLSNVWMP